MGTILFYAILILIVSAALIGGLAVAALSRDRHISRPRRNFPMRLKSSEKGGE